MFPFPGGISMEHKRIGYDIINSTHHLEVVDTFQHQQRSLNCSAQYSTLDFHNMAFCVFYRLMHPEAGMEHMSHLHTDQGWGLLEILHGIFAALLVATDRNWDLGIYC